MSRVTRYAFLAILLLLPLTLPAQDRIVNDSTGKTEYLRLLVGGYVGAGFNLHTANFGALPGVPSCCQEYKSATNIVPALGLLIEFPIMTDLHLQTRVGYTSLGGTLNSTEVIGNEPVLGDGTVPGGERRDVTVEHTLETGLPMIAVEPILAYRVIKNGWISAGLRGGFLMSSGFEQVETLVSPDGYTFLDGNATRNAVNGDIPDANSLQMHASVGLGYELPVGTGMTLVPEVRYYLPLPRSPRSTGRFRPFTLAQPFATASIRRESRRSIAIRSTCGTRPLSRRPAWVRMQRISPKRRVQTMYAMRVMRGS